MAKAAAWKSISWGECCGGAEVLTVIADPDMAMDGDEARCTECGRPGVVSADEDGAHINWHDVPGCECWWCRREREDLKVRTDHELLRAECAAWRRYERALLRDKRAELLAVVSKCRAATDAAGVKVML